MAAVIALAFVLLATPPAAAGAGQPPRDSGSFDAAALPVSFDRIRRQLDRLPAAGDEGDPLRLRFYVRVHAQAPPVEVLAGFDGFDLRNAPPRYGWPVHAEMRALATPTRHRFRNGTPAVSTGNVLAWGFGR